MHLRCADDTSGIGKDRQQSGLGHPGGAGSELRAPKMEGSWKVNQIKMLSGVGSDWIPRLKFVEGQDFEPATSGFEVTLDARMADPRGQSRRRVTSGSLAKRALGRAASPAHDPRPASMSEQCQQTSC